jgi:hypothetical protein
MPGNVLINRGCRNKESQRSRANHAALAGFYDDCMIIGAWHVTGDECISVPFSDLVQPGVEWGEGNRKTGTLPDHF